MNNNNRRLALALLCPLLWLTACAKPATPAEKSPAAQTQIVAHSVPAGETEEEEANEGVGDITPAALASLPAPAPDTDGVFHVKPYIQLGNAPQSSAKESLALLWQTADADAHWSVEYKFGGANAWTKANASTVRRAAIPGTTPYRCYAATLANLAPGQAVTYRVIKDGRTVFEAVAHPRKKPSDPFHFIVFGDCAADTPAQKAIAFQTYQRRPDFVFITGDIVYDYGLSSEYLTNYFPVYNAASASPETGAPLIRSTLFLAAPGNHDLLQNRNLDRTADGLAYFFNWSQPLNGPLITQGANTPNISGSEARQKAFIAAVGDAYPRMANFTFEYGNTHWLVLDSNPYVDWSAPELRAWVEKDLAAAQKATWRFVGFHHPPFNSSEKHAGDQWMRVLSDLFEKYHVDIVFNGHVHNYQRQRPLRFAAQKGENGKFVQSGGSVAGQWTLDKTFDGNTHTKPNGVLYLITGAGGNSLYNPEQQNNPASWKEFTAKYIADTHSLTDVHVSGKTLTIRQISQSGKELDHFILTK